MENLVPGKQVKFGLLYKPTKTLVQVEVESNCDEFSNGTQYNLISKLGQTTWLVNTQIHAEFVRNQSTRWYNSSYDTPTHNFKPEELEVVEVEIIINMNVVQSRLPTPEEYFTHKIKSDKGYEYIYEEWKKENARGTAPPAYGYWDLKRYIKEISELTGDKNA